MAIVKNTRTEMSLTGVEPALGNSTAVAPTTTIVETIALSAKVRPHGGTVATTTAKSTAPATGAAHNMALARTARAPHQATRVTVASRI